GDAVEPRQERRARLIRARPGSLGRRLGGHNLRLMLGRSVERIGERQHTDGDERNTHSYLKAVMGSSNEALRAGYSPKMTPTAPEKTTAMTIMSTRTNIG